MPHLFILIDPKDNYASYRNAFEKATDLPFLAPHIWQLKRYEQRAVSEMYPAGGYRNLIRSIQTQSLEKRDGSSGMEQVSWGEWVRIHVAPLLLCIGARLDKDRNVDS